VRQHIARASNTGWETWRSIERATPKVKIEIDVRVLYAREILTRVLRLAKLLREMGGQGRNRTADADLSRARPWKLGVTSESQNSPVSTNGVNSAMTQSVRILRKIKKDLKS